MTQGKASDKEKKPWRYRRPGVGRYQVMLPDDYVRLLDEMADRARSHHIEQAVKEYLERQGRL